MTYIVFDILEKDKKSLVGLPLSERRKILQQAVTEGPHVILSDPVESRGEEYYAAAVAKGLEGVIAKKKDSVYQPVSGAPGGLKSKPRKPVIALLPGTPRGRGAAGFRSVL